MNPAIPVVGIILVIPTLVLYGLTAFSDPGIMQKGPKGASTPPRPHPSYDTVRREREAAVREATAAAAGMFVSTCHIIVPTRIASTLDMILISHLYTFTTILFYAPRGGGQ